MKHALSFDISCNLISWRGWDRTRSVQGSTEDDVAAGRELWGKGTQAERARDCSVILKV